METKKQIPTTITKQQMFEIFKPLSADFIRKEINIIILENRKTLPAFINKSDAKIIKTRVVFKKELLLFIEIYGLPEIYENE